MAGKLNNCKRQPYGLWRYGLVALDFPSAFGFAGQWKLQTNQLSITCKETAFFIAVLCITLQTILVLLFPLLQYHLGICFTRNFALSYKINTFSAGFDYTC